MPIYEYACKACGHKLEVLQKISDPWLSDCPKCQHATLKRLVSAAGFRLKGTGWYETDFKSTTKPDAHSKDANKGSNDKQDQAKKKSPKEQDTKQASKSQADNVG